MQTAARNLATQGPNNLGVNPIKAAQLLPNVPNGLASGGLQVAPGVPVNLAKPVVGENAKLWQGATLPTQTVSNSQTKVVVKQTAPQALLTWKTFNIGKETTLTFDQSAGGTDQGKWIAFNKISDPSGVPSQILGSIEGAGQAYVVNANGIIFGGSSTVNLHTLVASSLLINDNLISRGLLNNPDQQFLFSNLPIAAGTSGTPAFNPLVTDPAFLVDAANPAHVVSQFVAGNGKSPSQPINLAVKYLSPGRIATLLDPASDYTLGSDKAGRTVITFTPDGITKVAGMPIRISYTPSAIKSGDVVVQKGAILTSPSSADKVGGRVALIGPNVRNEGTISTPDGQTILAAGLQVGMSSHATANPSLRGLDVFVGKVQEPAPTPDPTTPNAKPFPAPAIYAGTATNSGVINAPRANVTITGRVVAQQGAITSGTSVSLNGRIDLRAEFDAVGNPHDVSQQLESFLLNATGTVTLGKGSVTQILPEIDSSEAVVGQKLALSSQIHLSGRVLHLEQNSTLLAPGGAVTLDAGVWLPSLAGANKFVFANDKDPAHRSQIYLDQGALINVAGTTDAFAPLNENILSVEVRGAELADSPLQRKGVLRGITIQIDARKTGILDGRTWVGTPLANTAGYLGLVKRTAGEFTSAGGTVTLSAGNSVIVNQGSTIDVSGGWLNYEAGLVQTTRILAGAQLLDISQATPDRLYDGVYTGKSTFEHPKYALSESFTNPLALTGAHWEEGYRAGANGGAITIAAPSMALDGTLSGRMIVGPRQQSSLPLSSKLELSFAGQDVSDASFRSNPPVRPPNVIFQPDASQSAAGSYAIDVAGTPTSLRKDRQTEVILSPRLIGEGGFGNLKIDNVDGNISVPTGSPLTTMAGGSITLNGANVDIQAAVSAPGGTISFATNDVSPFRAALIALLPTAVTPRPDAKRGQFTLGTAALLSTAGLLIDERLSATTDPSLPLVTDGGAITIKSYRASLEEGSTVDVSGGVAVSQTGKRTYGKAGTIDLQAGRENNEALVGLIGGKLVLQSTLKGFSGTTGGSLKIQATTIQIGGQTTNADTLTLAPQFFSEGGFTSFVLRGLGAATAKAFIFVPGVMVAPDTVIAPVAQNWLADLRSHGGSSLSLVPITLPKALRTPVNITLEADGVIDTLGARSLLTRGDVVIASGAAIQTEPGASVIVKGDTALVLGSISAPGGSISISGNRGIRDGVNLFSNVSEAVTTVVIGPASNLSTAGETVLTPNPFGNRTGYVLSGGTISVSGNLITETGAVLDVSGSSAMLDFAPGYLGSPGVPVNSGLTARPYVPLVVSKRIDSDGGVITLSGSEMLFSNATLHGNAGGPSALGGSLAVSSGRFNPGAGLTPLDFNLVVTQERTPATATFRFTGAKLIGRAIPTGEVERGEGGVIAPVLGRGHFAVNSFATGGFDSLVLGGSVKFLGPVNITANRELNVASAGVLSANGAVTLAAAHVTLGQPFQNPFAPTDAQIPFSAGGSLFNFSPTFGTGTLTVTASLIDVGNLALRQIGQTKFIANNGVIRGDGTFDASGRIYLEAAQIHPPTGVAFNLSAADYQSAGKTVAGRVTIARSGTTELPLSAGGKLSIYAAVINQGGVLEAPFGQINLGWDGTGTAPKDLVTGLSVPISREVSLLSGAVTSVAGIDPATGREVIVPYGINLNGVSWIDPAGTDITVGVGSAKAITISGLNIADRSGSLIDIRGGGDLYSYRFVAGAGGSKDVLNSASSFAVIPGYQPNYAPFAAYNDRQSGAPLGGDKGYVSKGLGVGDRVHLGASSGLAAGDYTLLPARYALLPGAFLVTPKTGAPLGTVEIPEGSSLVAGYRFNSLNQGRTLSPLDSRFEVASSTVVRNRSEFADFTANTYLKQTAVINHANVPRLPIDAGHLILQATRSMSVQGEVLAQANANARGGLVDIASPNDIVIAGPKAVLHSGALVLDATQLSSFGAESLLVGGVRQIGAGGTSVIVKTGNITVDNAGAPLTGSDVILVANAKLTLAPGASVIQLGQLSGAAESLRLSGEIALAATGSTFNVGKGGGLISFPFGTPGDDLIKSTVDGVITRSNGGRESIAADTAVPISIGSTLSLLMGGTITFDSGKGGPIPIKVGDGTLLRVSSDPSARIVRGALSGSTAPAMVIGAGATVQGASVILDSTYATSLDATATVLGQSISLNSGQISVQFATPGTLQPTVGLVLAGKALTSLQKAQSLSLLSYSSIDLYGAGAISVGGTLALHAAELRGLNNNGGSVTFTAQVMSIDNTVGATVLDPVAGTSGALTLNAGTIQIGTGQFKVERFANLNLNASSRLQLDGIGSLNTDGALTATTPLVSGTRIAEQRIVAGGALTVRAPEGSKRIAPVGDLGVSLTLEGTSIVESSDIFLPSGSLTLHATGGDVTVAGRLDVGGTAQSFYDLVKYTSGGEIRIVSDTGSLLLNAGSILNVAAQKGGGNAGTLTLGAPNGDAKIAGQLTGGAGGGGLAGTFSLDVKELSKLGTLSTLLDAGQFTQSQSYRVRSGDVLIDGISKSHSFELSTDQGAIRVAGNIDASGPRGGSIALRAFGNVTLDASAVLTVAAQDFDAAGKGGSVSLEAGSQVNGVINPTATLELLAGSKIDLSVVSKSAGSAALGKFSGTLHLRAPQTAGGADVQVSAINGTVVGASSIVIEGYELFTAADGNIDNVIESVRTSGSTFSGNYVAITDRLTIGNEALKAVIHVRPGAEIINPTGDLILNSDWDLSTFRFGPTKDVIVGTDDNGDPIVVPVGSEPGVLTMRSAGNLIFLGALSDGFDPSKSGSLWLAPLMDAGSQSWSYRLTAGADFSATDFHRVQTLATLSAGSGSLLLGLDGGQNISTQPANSPLTSRAVSGHFQVIRTGTGDIEISAGRDVGLLNQFATIYTAGTQVADPTMGGTFDIPQINYQGQSPGSVLGVVQQQYPALYSLAGGNVVIAAQGNIARMTRANETLVADSSKELPINWLYRRGKVDEGTGIFANTVRNGRIGEVASTTWWVDFSNFFEGVGTLGGGNITMTAGLHISNVDAALPTNARMPGKNAGGSNIAPNIGSLIELGGGDLVVRSGRDIDGGVYYVERGQGSLSAGGSIHTNQTRSPSSSVLFGGAPLTQETWLPTTLFAGKASFDVSARGDLQLGPMVNPFLLPAGVGNPFWQRSYFTTFDPGNALNVASLGGTVTLRNSANFPDTGSTPIIQAWLQRMLLLQTEGAKSTSYFQPWLRLNVDSVEAFSMAAGITPATLRVTAYNGDIDLLGSITLSPSPSGTIELVTSGAINGLQPVGGATDVDGKPFRIWGASTINLSDSNPSSLPGPGTPVAQPTPINTDGTPNTTAGQIINTSSSILTQLERSFAESGATRGTNVVLQTQQALHAPGPLHAGDSEPIRLYAKGGDISGLTLFSPKAARIVADRDISDISFYVQNVRAIDVSVVSAGRDIAAYNPNSALRSAAQAAGNVLAVGLGGNAQPGDFQISGPGTIELLAGGKFDLGVGPNNGDGTALGATSIGNARNPSLVFEGANIIVGAGIGASAGLSNSQLDTAAFAKTYLDPATALGQRYLPELGTLLKTRHFAAVTGTDEISAAFAKLPAEQQAAMAVEIFYGVLRNAGRDHNDPASPGFGTYTTGFAAIAALFPASGSAGDILLTSREVKTANGGDISLFAPGGGLVVGFDIAGSQPLDQGILTEAGGNISIFTDKSVIVGTSRIFTLRGGNETIWSSRGDIASGASSKTVQSAPPTRVLIDPQSADVKTDLAGLATGGGIGVLDTVAGVPPGNVDLIAPGGAIDAGDAGIRVSGNLNLAATVVLNAGNIKAAGSTAGAPTTPAVSAPTISALTTTAPTSVTNAQDDPSKKTAQQQQPTEDLPSIISVDVISDGSDESTPQ